MLSFWEISRPSRSFSSFYSIVALLVIVVVVVAIHHAGFPLSLTHSHTHSHLCSSFYCSVFNIIHHLPFFLGITIKKKVHVSRQRHMQNMIGWMVLNMWPHWLAITTLLAKCTDTTKSNQLLQQIDEMKIIKEKRWFSITLYWLIHRFRSYATWDLVGDECGGVTWLNIVIFMVTTSRWRWRNRATCQKHVPKKSIFKPTISKTKRRMNNEM